MTKFENISAPNGTKIYINSIEIKSMTKLENMKMQRWNIIDNEAPMLKDTFQNLSDDTNLKTTIKKHARV